MEAIVFNLDFQTDALQFPCHPRHSQAAERITKELSASGLKSHFLIFSSGTTSADLKGYALSREALLANARAVNEHFELNSSDVWGLSLPPFHVGGLSVLARAWLLGTSVVDLGPWKPQEWVKDLIEKKVTITTVVPTQIYDLIHYQLQAPSSLKYLIVGGDYLSSDLEKRALELNWPVIRTFGMTEVCSQLASGKTPLAPMKILPIHQVKIQQGCLKVKSASLFTLQFKLKDQLQLLPLQDFCDEEGFYLTQDLAEVSGQNFRPLGRRDDQIKISGKLISLNSLKEILCSYTLQHGLYGQAEIALEDDPRLGKKATLLTLPGVEIPDELFYPLRLEKKVVAQFERTDLGKLKQPKTSS